MGQKDGKIRRSYSCSDLAQLLDVEGGGDGEGGNNGGTGESVKREGRDVATCEVTVREVSSFVKLRKKRSWRKKGRGVPVISAPVQPSNTPPTRKLPTILPQNINFSNPFGTIGRRNKRKPREGMPVVVLEKCFGPPPSSALPTVAEQNVCMYPHMNPFATLPRNAAKLLGMTECSSSGNESASECDSHSANLESFLSPSASTSVSRSSSRSPSRSPSPSLSPSTSPSHSLRAALGVENTNSLTAPNYLSLLGKSMEKVCFSCVDTCLCVCVLISLMYACSVSILCVSGEMLQSPAAVL